MAPQRAYLTVGPLTKNAAKNKAVYLFESNWKKHYSDRGIRKIMQKYTKIAEIEHSISPHKLRHFLFTWMKKMGVDDALIQPYSGHESRKSLEIYSKLSLAECQEVYENQIKKNSCLNVAPHRTYLTVGPNRLKIFLQICREA